MMRVFTPTLAHQKSLPNLACHDLLPCCAQADRNIDAPDKPTLALLAFMARSSYVAPADWAGSRELE